MLLELEASSHAKVNHRYLDYLVGGMFIFIELNQAEYTNIVREIFDDFRSKWGAIAVSNLI